MSEKKSKSKYLLYSAINFFVPLILLLLVLELSARIVYFQQKSEYKLGVFYGIEKIRNKITDLSISKVNDIKSKEDIKMKKVVEDMGFTDIIKKRGFKYVKYNLVLRLYSEEGTDLLKEYEKQYEDSFKALVNEAHKIHSKLIVLYPPMYSKYTDDLNIKDFEKFSKNRREVNRKFYNELTRKYNVDYLDLTEEITKYPDNWVTLLPEDIHLSRFGNQVVEKEIAAYIDKFYDTYRSDVTFQNRPEILGYYRPNLNETYEIIPDMPFHFRTNKQGLRIDYDLTSPKKQQRILILGDSYTYGPHLASRDAYPNLLDRRYKDKEIINAGVGGFSITGEASLLLEKAKYMEPDIIILQVLDNDLEGFFFIVKDEFNELQNLTLSPLERDYMKKVRDSLTEGVRGQLY
ncbi:MAG: SGNH/GDSL hydrolase family protein [Nitrospirae bacterium]|nr:SGNH/GDSL hydrolase family protein [Nitrospirota bacterium]